MSVRRKCEGEGVRSESVRDEGVKRSEGGGWWE